jgi:hypothetical protein
MPWLSEMLHPSPVALGSPVLQHSQRRHGENQALNQGYGKWPHVVAKAGSQNSKGQVFTSVITAPGPLTQRHSHGRARAPGPDPCPGPGARPHCRSSCSRQGHSDGRNHKGRSFMNTQSKTWLPAGVIRGPIAEDGPQAPGHQLEGPDRPAISAPNRP